MKKLRSPRSNLTQAMDEEDLNSLLGSLFPECEEVDMSGYWRSHGRVEVEKIYADEVRSVIKRKGASNTALGVDGVRMGTLRALTEQELRILAFCFTRCLEEGKFPEEWKRAYLVLIPKVWPLDANNPKVRPICLLNEVGKVLKSIIADRLTTWMDENPRSQLSEFQYGFRRNRSTTDALILLRTTIEEVWQEKGVAIAVSVDIKNAINSLLWEVIRCALRKKSFPDYLRRIIDDYLFNRSVEYIGEDSAVKEKRMLAGLPQGSVLGPILWNIGYDSVLQERTDFGCMIICYADDTLVLAVGEDANVATARTYVQVGRVKSNHQTRFKSRSSEDGGGLF